MFRAFIALGSNLGDRRAYIDRALQMLSAPPQLQLLATSSVYETDPEGGPPGQGRYLNAVVSVETLLSPRSLLERLFEIERDLGRVRGERNAARTIDLDLLFYDALVMDEPGLTVPHPRIQDRRFVLEPLAEIAPDFVHPVLGVTVKELLDRLRLNQWENSKAGGR